MGLRLDDLVPAHMRNLETLHARCGKARHVSCKDAEPGNVALFAALEEHLHPYADAEKWLGAHRFKHSVACAACSEFVHAARHGALSRHDDTIGCADHVRISRNDNLR